MTNTTAPGVKRLLMDCFVIFNPHADGASVDAWDKLQISEEEAQ